MIVVWLGFHGQNIVFSLQKFTTNWYTCVVMLCRIFDTSENTLEIPFNFWNMVLGKDGKDQLDRCCEKVLHRVNEESNILHKVKRRKANWIGHNWRWNCFLKDVIEGKGEGRKDVTERRGRRCGELLNDLKEKKRYWRTRCVRAYGPVTRQIRRWWWCWW